MPERQLSWQLGFSLSRKPTKRAAPRRNTQQGFEFVMEHPQRSYRRARYSPSEIARDNAQPSSSSASREKGSSIVASTYRAHFQSEAVEEEDHEPPIDADPSSFEALARAPCPHPPPLPPTMEYSSLTERFRPILTRCNASHSHSSGLSS